MAPILLPKSHQISTLYSNPNWIYEISQHNGSRSGILFSPKIKNFRWFTSSQTWRCVVGWAGLTVLRDCNSFKTYSDYNTLSHPRRLESSHTAVKIPNVVIILRVGTFSSYQAFCLIPAMKISVSLQYFGLSLLHQCVRILLNQHEDQ